MLLVSSGLVVGLVDNIFLKVIYGEGFRFFDFQFIVNSLGIVSGIFFKVNDFLDVECSCVGEVEINVWLFENKWLIK